MITLFKVRHKLKISLNSKIVRDSVTELTCFGVRFAYTKPH